MRCGKMRVEGRSGRSARSLVSPRTRRAPVEGAWGSPRSPPHQGNKTQRSACRRGTKVPAPSCGFAGAAPGEDVMAKLINELLLLTCMGAFIANATYAVTLLH
jgi:hypothetical protein